MKNMRYLWKLCFRTAPGFMLYWLYDGFRYEFFVFLEHTIGIQYILKCAEHQYPFKNAVICIAIILGCDAIQLIFDGYFQNGMVFKYKPMLYQALKMQMYEKAATLDLTCYDNPKYYNELVLAVAESEKSIDRFLDILKLISQSITVVITSGVFFLMTNAVGVLFALASFILTAVFSERMNKLNYKLRLKRNPLERRSAYVQRVNYLNAYAKEIRLNPSVKEILNEDYEQSMQQMEQVEKDVSAKRVRIVFFKNYVSGDFITHGLYIAYLVFQAAVLHTIDYSSAIVLLNTVGNLREGLQGFAQLGPKVSENNLYVNKIQEFLAYEPKLHHQGGVPLLKKPGVICLSHVNFAYEEGGREILHDINMEVKPGERVALVGYNGAGKTTLIKILMRLYDPTSGTITYDGIDIRDYNLDSYHERIGVVFQDYQIYGASLLENVVLEDTSRYPANRDSVEQGVRQALHESGFKERLELLEQGLDTSLTTEFDDNGVNLSGGESQKVAIARVFFRDANVIIMDEPSSALDPIAEYNLNLAMKEAAVDKTVFYISHRLSTTRDADRIFMMDKGEIIESGTHDELMEKDGRYAEMWNAQAGKYLENDKGESNV